MERRVFNLGIISAVAASVATRQLTRARAADANHFALSLGWTEGESGQHLLRGYKDTVASVGGTLTVTDAAYDSKRQADQIDAHVKSKPDALLLTASDPAAIAPAVKRAIDAGIPVFAADSLIPGAAVNTTCLSNNFGMGAATLDFIAKKLNGKGNIALVDLPANETWDERADGLRYALQRWPDIKVVAKWSYNSSGTTTPRQGVEGLLNANSNIDAIWCAWDGAAIAGALAAQAAGRNLFTTGIDGGKQAFSTMKAGLPMAATVAQDFYEEAFMNVHFAANFLAGKKVPRLVITPTYLVTDAMVKAGNVPDDYDHPGKAIELGWKPT